MRETKKCLFFVFIPLNTVKDVQFNPIVESIALSSVACQHKIRVKIEVALCSTIKN